MTKEEAYKSLAPFIQDYIYEKRWTDLNALQIATIEEVMQGENNLLLMAGTAQGKTEAAFLPTITRILQNNVVEKGIGILYISPLKALINDQFERIEEMLAKSELSITKWHGDAADSRKLALLENPTGILQMTPESLEAMLCLHADRVVRLFKGLQFVIIDEIHYFIHEQRGVQLLALLERMQRLAGCRPRRIGLSATIQNQEEALAYLDLGSPYRGKVLAFKMAEQRVTCSVTTTGILKEEVPERYYKKLSSHCMGKRVLLFTNSRRQCEEVIAGLKKYAREHYLPDIYHVHHGSISKNSREEIETYMQKEDGPVLTGTTLTLELGIDIGNLDEVIQAADPVSISSMVQRLGRSGRRNGRSAISFHLQYRDDHNDRKKLELQLIRSIAMIELNFREHYMEERFMPAYPFRFLAHTVLSVICEKGCLYPPQLAKAVLSLGVFRQISQEHLKDLLLYMIEKKVLKRYEDGAIGLDDEGERIVGRMDFFAVFEASVSMTVYYLGAQIGEVDRAYSPGSFFYLAGKVWEVTECDIQSKRIDVEEAEGEADIRFGGYVMTETDHRVMTKMHEVLASEEEYAYLDAESKATLARIREKARQYGFTTELGRDPSNAAILQWCPSLSTKTIATLFHIFRAHDIHCERIYCKNILYGIRFFGCTESSFHRYCLDLAEKEILIDNAYAARNMKYEGKYFDLLPDNLKAKEILEDFLDLEGAREVLATL